MSMGLTVLGITFHWYGLIIGVATVVGWSLIDYRYALESIKNKYRFLDLQLTQIMSVGLLTGLLAARLWHVLTDWHLYQTNPLATFYIWNGGLSIVGALLGASVGVAGMSWWLHQQDWHKASWYIMDIIVYGLPIAQAIGRLGNWVNQELYGLPTTLPWGLYIEPVFRLDGYEQFNYFHPLFAYEAILTLLFGSGVWLLWYKQRKPVLGEGKLAVSYVWYYSVVRFGLDFLRLDKATFLATGLGFNQVVFLIVSLVCGVWFARKRFF
jgi:phosphatidylglycerol:prolipoprotein diacylglycerol transferase